jgi:signal peptidase II
MTVTQDKKTSLHWLWLAAAIIIIDQVSKIIVTHTLSFNVPVHVLPWLNLNLVHNKGAAFNFLSQFGDIALWLFIGTAIIVSIFLCVWLYRLPASNRWLGVSLSLILGGAIGNLLDRLFYGYVVDFIHFHIQYWNFAIFNVADSAITIGAIMLIIDIFKRK